MALFGSKRLQSQSHASASGLAGRHVKHSRRAPGIRSTQLSFETLETRTLLAADMLLAADYAEITGLVQNDTQGDGNHANDTIIAGAAARLYLDSGDGTFGTNDSLVGTEQLTDADGRYRFQGLGAGKYFVSITPPADTHFRPGQGIREVNISAAEAEGAIGMTIDGFTSEQIVTASPPLPSSDPSSLLDETVMGGERDMFVELTQGTNPLWRVALVSGGGTLQLASDSSVTGSATITWDGDDGDAQSLNPTGLGGVDLTRHEGNTMTGVSLTVGADHPDAQVKLKVFTDAQNWTEYTTMVPATIGGEATRQVNFRFDDLPANLAGQGADFSEVGAIELTFEGVSAVDGQVSRIGMVGLTTKTADFTLLPYMSLGDTVWNDANHDGQHDSGELGIAGVEVNLFQDTDGNNSYTPGTDLPLDSATTDGNGNYLFAGLFPDDYVVQIDQANFRSNGRLEEMRSTTGNVSATDPDNDIDRDDNGTQFPDVGVLSQAVTLVGASEPTNDGDNNSNSNQTVDFGFYGFDLVLDKSVEKMAVTPSESLTYRVLVTNEGPSTAYDVQFSDTLPQDVSYQSGLTSKQSAHLQHTSGVVTSNLGTMHPGDSVTVTIIGNVDTDASETLVNTATVSAEGEINLSNNTDSVSNPLSSRIDLAIEKTDSRDPVEPGSTFSYQLDVVNHGPSTATGVTITDSLPDEGITYLDATVAPTSIADGEVIFHVGNLERGERTSVTITVQVDESFVGRLDNLAEVHGNETETNQNNNQDTEPTLVESDPASLAGSVFVDSNDNGQFDSTERPLAGVELALVGLDFRGTAVTRSTTTAADGSYKFDDLPEGNYHLVEKQPDGFEDGKDHLGSHGGTHGEDLGSMLLPQDVALEEISDLFIGIELEGGDAGTNYDFGELAITFSKRSFLAR
jgi:uncharacterized repeat protein (TIGR01451 family)